MKFRKKPVVVEAVQFDGTAESISEIIKWIRGSATPAHMRIVHVLHAGALAIDTLEGQHRATPGDWIIQGVKGEFYPCKPDIFEATYAPVEEMAA